MSQDTGGTVEAAARAGWRRGAGLAGAAIGVVAAGATVGVAVERLTVGRGVRRKARLALDAAGPYGTLRGTPAVAVAEDGTELAYEVEPGPARGAEAGDQAGPPVTLVFCHGYCLGQDSWHFQRAALAGTARAVYWDQRSHGRSERGRAQREHGEPVTIDLLGRDLKAVIDAAAPEGPLVLVGHSMGGMTVMALAAQFPELVRRRVVGAAFVGTSAGKLSEVSFGLPAAGVRAVRRVLPSTLRPLGAQAELLERGGGRPVRRGDQALLVRLARRGPGCGAVRRAADRGDADRRGGRVLPGLRRARQVGGAARLRRRAGPRAGG